MSRTTDRCDVLYKELDMKFCGDGSYIGKADDNKDFNVGNMEICCDSDEEWELKIKRLKAELARRRGL